uniref:Peptide-binding protein n=1 Tax=Desulfobacca acetoxidans TaxID=60893 RepID=A0A7V6DPP2_9BACT
MKNTFLLTGTWLIILLVPAWATTASIGQDKVNVRKAPNLKAEVIFQAHLGYPVELEKTQGQWVQIKDWQNNEGWVHRSLINQNIQTAVIVPEEVNVRKGPGLHYPVVTQVKCGEVYKIFNAKKGWVQIGYYVENQEIGWIRKDLVWGE